MKNLRETRESYLWAIQRIREDQQSSLVINRIQQYVEALESRLPIERGTPDELPD
jgi:Mn-dependent DtxR family transcriptional regulator